MNGNRKQIELTRRQVLKGGVHGVLAATLGNSVWLGGCSSRNDKANIILITLDTTRADHLGCYEYHRPTSPNLDRLAEQSMLYTRMIAPSSWTLPSHASLFTGKFPSCHGAHYDEAGRMRLTQGIEGPAHWDELRARALDANALTLATLLKEAGYATGAVVGGPWMKSIFELNRGFEFYDDEDISTVNGRRAEPITASAVKWIETLGEKRFFLFLNYFDVHHPFNAPGKYGTAFFPPGAVPGRTKETVETYRAGYDGELLYMDHHIGRLMTKLKDLKLYDNSWIIVTADHGDLLGEHGKTGHGKYLTQHELHIPLFMKYPHGEVSPGQSDSRVQLIDLLPLICDHHDLPLPDGIQGNLPSEVQHPIFAETYPLKATTLDGHWRAIFDGDFKFIWNSLGRHQLFNLAKDPEENHNLFGKEPKRDQQLLAKLDTYLNGLPKPAKSDFVKGVDEKTIQALKAQGYLK